MNPRMEVIFGAYIGIEDGKIVSIERKPPAEAPKAIVDGTGMVAIPGLINCHTHLATASLRCFTDDLGNTEALQALLQKEAKMDSRSAKAAASLAIAECLRFGVTSVSDLYYYPNATAEAVAESGIKANISRGTSMFLGDDFCFDTFPACQELVALKDKWHNYDNGRIKIEASIHAEYTSTYQLWDALAEYAINNGLQLQVHLSETKKEHDECVEKYGLTPAQVLDCHHVFDVPTVAAHCVHVTQEDMQLLAKRHVSAAHCPVSNLKLASGCADVLGMVKARMNVCLGTDSVASNNNLDLFEEIKAAAHFTGQGVDDFAGMYFGYADGKKLSISCGMCTSQRADRFYLYGTEGTLEAPIPYNAKGALHYSIVRGDVVTTKTMQVEDNYKLEIEQLGRCVLNGEKPWVSHRFSIENAKIIDRVLEAIGY